MMGAERFDFVVFSDDWGRHASSCQHLFARLARRHRVLWVNTIGMRAPKADAFTVGRGFEKLREWRRPLRRIHDNLHVYAPPMLPAAAGAAGRLNVRWVARGIRRVMKRLGFDRPILLTSLPTGADYLGRLGERASVYYITDDYRFWPGADADIIAAQDARLTAEADLVLPCGEALAENCPNARRLELLPHAVDLDHFAVGANDSDLPNDLKAATGPKLCFFGLIYEKIDLDLLARLARTQPDKHIVLIGPVKTDLSALDGLPNVHVLGPKPYYELPRYLHNMDALLLAYRLDEQTTRNAPLKIRECLAVGKPIVAKGIPDLNRYANLIHLADNDDAFLDACDQAYRAPKATPVQMRAAVADDTWEARARQVEHALKRVMDVSTPTAIVTSHSLQPAGAATICSDAAAWDRYVTSHPDGRIWHRWVWPAAMRSVYGMRCWTLTINRGGRLTGVLPLALQNSRAFGKHLVSLPWLDYAGVLADDAEARAALLRSATELAKRLDADLTIRQRTDAPRLNDDTATGDRTDKLAMTLDLPDDADTLWAGLRAKVRNQVRKARKSGLAASWVGPSKLDEFYRVYATNMRDLGSPPHATALFAELIRQLPDVARLMLVTSDNQTVAGALVLADSAGWQVPWASSLRSANALCPNHLMYWTILESACGAAGQFCFGRSSRDSGTHRFKAQWGAREEPLLWRTYLGDGSDAAENGRATEWGRQLWRRMPVSIARTLGPKIIRCVG